tara:strand:+ start:58 stop:246 length:189 start_codon:yes stop_codon:yes gene_type:complete
MQRYIILRLVQAVLTLFILAVVIFFLARASGDPIALMVPPEATFEDEQAVRAALGLDRSYPV